MALQVKVERDPYCQELIAQRCLDGLADPGPVFPDVEKFEWSMCPAPQPEGLVGGFPCQAPSFFQER